MDKYDNHFLDSCVILGKLLDFDSQYNYAKEYFKKPVTKHVSNRVVYEVKDILNGIRREMLGFIHWIKTNEFNGTITDQNILGYIHRYPLYDNSARNRKRMERIYEKYFPLIKDYILTNSPDLLDDVESTAIGSISIIHENLFSMIKDSDTFSLTIHTCPITYSNHFADVYNGINSLIQHEPDSLILTDSYFIRYNIVQEDMGFITSDNEHILPNRSTIEPLITGLFIFDLRSIPITKEVKTT